MFAQNTQLLRNQWVSCRRRRTLSFIYTDGDATDHDTDVDAELVAACDTCIQVSQAGEGKRKSKSPKCNFTTDDGGIGTVDGAAWLGLAS
eukprot:COSAG01_NODE_5128_length_4469_cov_4.067506_1_plen_90_part_00